MAMRSNALIIVNVLLAMDADVVPFMISCDS